MPEPKPASIHIGENPGHQVRLERWSLTETHHPANNSSRMQLSGRLPEGFDPRGPLAQAICGDAKTLHRAELPGKHAHILITDATVNVEIEGTGQRQLLMMLTWPHQDDDGQAPEGGICHSDGIPLPQDSNTEAAADLITRMLAVRIEREGGVWDATRVLDTYDEMGWGCPVERAEADLKLTALRNPGLLSPVEGEPAVWKARD